MSGICCFIANSMRNRSISYLHTWQIIIQYAIIWKNLGGNHMKRKVLATLLAITLTAGCMTPLSATAEEQVTEIEENSMIQNNGAGIIVQSGSCGENASYTLDEDGVLTISGSGAIEEHAFSDRDDVKKVIISKGISGIGDCTFYGCSSLSSIKISEGVTSIGGWAFYECSSLNSISIPEGVTSIGDSAFYECSSLNGARI